MGDDFNDFEDYDNVSDDWVDDSPAPEKPKIENAKYDFGEVKKPGGLTLSGIGFSKNGKSLMGSLLPYLNRKWWSESPAKAGKGIPISKYPLTKRLILEGIIPEVEVLQVIDLDGSYDSKSRLGVFGKLTAPLYEAKMIKKTTIKVPGRVVKISDNSFKELAKKEIELAKIKFDNEVVTAVQDNGPEVALLIDPYDELERLLSNMFRIVYEEDIAPVRPLKGGKTKDFYSSSLDGIPQKFWQMRNSWVDDSLRMKRDYAGISYDTFKIDQKDPKYLKEGELDYKIVMTKRAHYFMDVILWYDTHEYKAKVINRFKGNQDRHKPLDFENAQMIHYTPNRARAIYDIFEALAPSLLGMIEKPDGTFEDIDIWAD